MYCYSYFNIRQIRGTSHGTLIVEHHLLVKVQVFSKFKKRQRLSYKFLLSNVFWFPLNGLAIESQLYAYFEHENQIVDIRSWTCGMTGIPVGATENTIIQIPKAVPEM